MAEISLAVSLLAVSGFMLFVGKNLIGKMIVLIDEEINLQASFSTFVA